MLKTGRNSRNVNLVMVAILVGLVVLAGCRPDYPKCETDEHCSDSDEGAGEGKLFCVNGLCQECKADADCGDPAFECNAGSCDRIPDYCSETSKCPGSQSCRQNRCGPECRSNEECPDGKLCEGGSCQEKPQCSADADCPDGKRCADGMCVEATDANADCGTETVFFSYDSATLGDAERDKLQANAKCILQKDLKILLEGHCDERGTSEYNIALGERRAQNVYKFLVSLGVESGSLQKISYGEERTRRYCGEDGRESCHESNRRVEFRTR
jgi:peptidoglycan-associated lipoprotein